MKPAEPSPPEAPRVSEAPPSAARAAEGMMTVPLPKPSDGGEPGPAAGS
jgi:hypothetical protein